MLASFPPSPCAVPPFTVCWSWSCQALPAFSEAFGPTGPRTSPTRLPLRQHSSQVHACSSSKAPSSSASSSSCPATPGEREARGQVECMRQGAGHDDARTALVDDEQGGGLRVVGRRGGRSALQ